MGSIMMLIKFCSETRPQGERSRSWLTDYVPEKCNNSRSKIEIVEDEQKRLTIGSKRSG